MVDKFVQFYYGSIYQHLDFFGWATGLTCLLLLEITQSIPFKCKVVSLNLGHSVVGSIVHRRVFYF